MRALCLVALVVVFPVASTVRAEDAPQGAIGIQLKIEDGKMVIVEALKDGPAEKAGIKSDDVLLRVNDFKAKDKIDTEDLQEMVKELGKHKPGEKIKLTIKRGEKEMVVEVTVGKRSEVLKKVKE
mgnify:CR=1 FL=1